MTGITRILLFMVSCVFTQNVVFARLLGSGAAVTEKRGVGVAAGMGLAVTVVMTLTALCGWLAWNLALVPLNAQYLMITALVLIAAAAAWLSCAILGRLVPALSGALEESLPIIAVNCAVLGIAVLNIESGYGLGDAVLAGLFGGLGFLLAIVCMAGVQERIAYSRVPEPLKGLPISLISASLIALAFMGFMGLGR